MKRAIWAAAAAAALAGCTATSWSNPGDTSGEREMLAYHDELLLSMERERLRMRTETEPAELPELKPNLDLWRATVLETANAATLAKMERESRARMGLLKAVVTEHDQSPYRVHHYALLLAKHDLAVEEVKLGLISVRRSQVR